MIADRLRRAAALALCAALAGSLAAKDVKDAYKGSLDPAIPQQRAALDLLERIEKTPNDASLHNDLACLIAREGYWQDALSEFALAAELDKTDGRPLYNAGLVHATRGEWGTAASSFRGAVSRAPGNWTAWWMLGYAEERRGYDDSAVSAYKKSLRADKSLFDVRRNPFAAYTRLKARVMVESYEGTLNSKMLPSMEQFSQADLLTSFQRGRVTVTAAPGAPVPAGKQVPAGAPVAAGVAVPVPATAPVPAGAQAPPAAQDPEGQTARPGPGGGPVVTSVPPVSASRPSPPPGPANSVPAPPPTSTRADEPIPPDFPTQSPAGPAPAKKPLQPGPGFGGGAPVEPTPTTPPS